MKTKERQKSLIMHDPEAEQAILGACLNDVRAIATCAVTNLHSSQFYGEANRNIYIAIRMMHAKKIGVDLVTLTDALRAAGKLEAVGGAAYLAQVFDMVPTVAHVRYYIQIVQRMAKRRSVITQALKMLEQARNETVEISTIVEGIEQWLKELQK
jgi:replicative DNA helicase